MAHKKKQLVRKLTRTGPYTYYLVIPKEFVEILHWRERQKLVIKKFGKGIVIKDWKK